MTDPNNMTPEEFTLSLVPTPDDLADAGAWLAAQTRLDPQILLQLYIDAYEKGRLFHLLVAVGETAVRATHLRDDPEALPTLLASIAQHRLTQESE